FFFFFFFHQTPFILSYRKDRLSAGESHSGTELLTWEKRLFRARSFFAKQSARVLRLRGRKRKLKEGKKQRRDRKEANSAAKVGQSS
ncbi:unnamed protein product, partial [Arabidopsis halleri]